MCRTACSRKPTGRRRADTHNIDCAWVSMCWGHWNPSVSLNLNSGRGAVVHLRNGHGVLVVVSLGQKSWSRQILESSRGCQTCTGKATTIIWNRRTYFRVVLLLRRLRWIIKICEFLCVPLRLRSDACRSIVCERCLILCIQYQLHHCWRFCLLHTVCLFIPKHFRGRKNRCYSLAVRAVRRAFVYATKARRLKKRNMRTVRHKDRNYQKKKKVICMTNHLFG